ncbi:hypothetical protein Q1M64_01900 (plasmid) [Sinorhizobium meliloti]|nr:hypothetical protein Q1M64_01900 [Sinorhizobium meliloti]
MQELAGFIGIALKMVRSEQELQQALEQQELLTREMSHRLKKPFHYRRRHDPHQRPQHGQQG